MGESGTVKVLVAWERLGSVFLCLAGWLLHADTEYTHTNRSACRLSHLPLFVPASFHPH